ncbi:MAG: NRDE family protein [Magnetococcales bacterium]|nr:NRDE family protein [Magnetococcales bacterium]
MCSVILHFDPRHKWPIRMAANRDEMMDRPWLPPGYHWPAWHRILAGKDIKGGGSWMGMNHAGVVAVILNRFGTLGSKPGKSSRGGLILSALQHDNAAQAVSRVDASLRNARYRPCNLIVADATSAYVISLRARAGDEDATSISIDPISQWLGTTQGARPFLEIQPSPVGVAGFTYDLPGAWGGSRPSAGVT